MPARGSGLVSLIADTTERVQHWGAVAALLLCPRTRDLFTASRDFRIKRWAHPLQSPSCAANLSGHTGWVTCLAAYDNLLLSGSYDTTVRVWDADANAHLHTFTQQHSDYVLCLAAAPQASRLVSAGLRGQLNYWDLHACKAVAYSHSKGTSAPRGSPVTLGGEVSSGSIYALDVTPNGRLAAFNGTNGCVSHRQRRCRCCVALRTVVRDAQLHCSRCFCALDVTPSSHPAALSGTNVHSPSFCAQRFRFVRGVLLQKMVSIRTAAAASHPGTRWSWRCAGRYVAPRIPRMLVSYLCAPQHSFVCAA